MSERNKSEVVSDLLMEKNHTCRRQTQTRRSGPACSLPCSL